MLSNLNGKRIILASKSPRRQELLKGLNVKFEVKTIETDESFSDTLKREDIPLYLSKIKAEPFAEELKKDDLLITCDTIVWVNNKVLNKPADRDEAIKMLTVLQNNDHVVYTAVTLTTTSFQFSFYEETKVYFNELSKEEIEYYVDNFKPYDKAGAYGVQEWLGYVGIKKIEGCFYNVMGLPLNKLYQNLKEL